jgi:hypothetical protein
MSDTLQDINQLRLALQEEQENVRRLREELYRRQGQSAPPPLQEQPVQPGQSDERAKLQEALDLARKIAQIYKTELDRMAATSIRADRASQMARPLTTGQQRGCLLSAWLCLSAIGTTRYFVTLMLSGLSFFGFILSAIILVVALTGIRALWKLQKAGYYLLVGLSTAVILLNASVMIAESTYAAFFLGFLDIVLDLFHLLILSFLVLLRWKYLE